MSQHQSQNRPTAQGHRSTPGPRPTQGPGHGRIVEQRAAAGPVRRHTLSVLVQDVPGVLTRVAGLFARRAFNIHSLAVGVTEVPGLSRITVVVEADERLLEQVTKQLHKLINVLKVVELPDASSVQRDHLLVKVRTDSTTRPLVVQAAELFRAGVVDVAPGSLTLEATGSAAKLNALLAMLEPYRVTELVRSGTLGLARGSKSLTDRAGQRGSA